MLRKLPLSIFFILVVGSCFAQDTLVYYNEITFSTPFEKRVWDDHFLNQKTDLFNLFMANGVLLNEAKIEQARKRYYDHLKQLAETINTQNKRNDKKLKYIYDNVHQTFLSKFELVNKFEDIFNNGFYNCVSASALYSVTFDRLSIPFVIKEKPTHVYLIAFPASEQIMVETTSPTSAYNSINQEFKTGYVKMLKDQKIISNSEYVTENANTLFDKHYFGEQEEISILNLIGIQYMNDGLYKFDDKKYTDALQQLEKAYLFYPSNRVGYLLYMTLHFVMENETDPIKEATYLGKLSRFKNYGTSSEMIQGEFSRVVYKLLFESADKPKLEKYYHKLDSAIQDQELKKELASIYNFESGRYLYNQGHYKTALPILEKALELKPNNLEVNNLFIVTLAQILETDGVNTAAIQKIENYAIKYPSLQSNNFFNKLLATAYLFQFSSAYDFNRPAEGEKFKTIFESHMTKYPDLSVENNLVGKAYSIAAVYYFRKGQTAKSRSIITKGLVYAPNNNELLARQRMIK